MCTFISKLYYNTSWNKRHPADGCSTSALLRMLTTNVVLQEGDAARNAGLRYCQATLKQQHVLGASPSSQFALEELDE
jgi:hypothetical protein